MGALYTIQRENKLINGTSVKCEVNDPSGSSLTTVHYSLFTIHYSLFNGRRRPAINQSLSSSEKTRAK